MGSKVNFQNFVHHAVQSSSECIEVSLETCDIPYRTCASIKRRNALNKMRSIMMMHVALG